MLDYNIKSDIIEFLWDGYVKSVPFSKEIFNNKKPTLDHLAIVDLPQSDSTGIPFLKKLFTKLGFEQRGSGYLEDKQNDFIWVTDPDSDTTEAHKCLPQVVLADFRLDLFSENTQDILKKYMLNSIPFDFQKFETLYEDQPRKAGEYVKSFLSSRSWPTPFLNDYNAVNKENQLLGWSLLFGRKVNHFGINLSFETEFKNLEDYNSYLKTIEGITLNNLEKEIKGGKSDGISQSSTLGNKITVHIDGEDIHTTDSFMEFVWRHPETDNPKLWNDYFTGFVAKNANKVIESLYAKNN